MVWAGMFLIHAYTKAMPTGNDPVLRVSSNEPLLYYFGYVQAGSVSASRTIRFSTQNVTSRLTVTCPAGFELSKNNISFFTSIQYEVAELGQNMNCFVRFKPTIANKGFGGSVKFNAPGVSVQRPDLSGSSLPENLSLDVVTWNLEWFGGSLGPADDDRQMGYAAQVMDSLGADIYILQEIVDTSRLGTLSRMLINGPYDYFVSLYASNALNQLNGNWRSGQKLAFLYKRNMFSTPNTRGFTQTSTQSDNYYNWANGRYPFFFESNVTIDGITKRIVFLSVHAKAEMGDTDDYLRRKGAAELMYDSLNIQLPMAHVLIAGDYNDDLDQTISSVFPGSPTPYIRFMNDTIRYKALSFWNSLRGDNSYIGYPNMVDHSIASDDMVADYVDFSCIVRKDAADWVTSYGQDLSDHYPVMSRFNLRQSNTNLITSIPNQPRIQENLYRIMYVQERPESLLFERGVPGVVSVDIINQTGQLMWRGQSQGLVAGTRISLPIFSFPPRHVYRHLKHTKRGFSETDSDQIACFIKEVIKIIII